MKKIKNQAEFTELVNSELKDFSGYMYEGNELDCANNSLTSLPDMPLITDLYCSNNSLTSLPEMPLITDLYCSNNSLTSLPEMPLITWLSCYNNSLTSLPDMPLITKLDCSNNSLTSLPDMPLITILYCSSNAILNSKINFTNSPTSDRSVYYQKSNNKVLTGCFSGTLEEFYQKGFIEEKKEWVKEFYLKNK